MRTVLLQALATRADSGALAALQAALHDLSARVTALRQLEQSKADQAALDHLRDELQTLLYRGIDDVDRTFRMLLDTKANTDAVTDAVTEVGAALDHRLHGMRQRLEQQVQAVDARKADASAIDAARNEMLATLHSIEALGTTFRALLDGKAATTEVAEVGAALDQRLHSMQQDLERQVEALDARKADAGAIEMARNEMLEALRTALTGLTGSVGAVAATRVDRATVNALLAENSKTLQAQFQDSVRELRTSIEELSAR
jgi:predicted ribosome quality control (RQC) complex YloA/Tae2 family protein